MSRLQGAAAAFVAANILHTLDHLRTGVGRLSGEIIGAGTLLSIAAALLLAVAGAREVVHHATA